jgi:hypothetical protein
MHKPEMNVDTFKRFCLQHSLEVVGTTGGDSDPLECCFGEIVIYWNSDDEWEYPAWARIFAYYIDDQYDIGHKLTGGDCLKILEYLEANRHLWHEVILTDEGV